MSRRRGVGVGERRWVPGSVVGIDPHKRSLSATVIDERGGLVASEHFRVSGEGHRALEAWARQFGPIARWGIEGAASWGRHTAVFLLARGYDVRDVCPARAARSERARQRGKSDTLDSERIARETLAHPLLPRAFKHVSDAREPDQLRELLGAWHARRRVIVAHRQQVLAEAEALLCALPLEITGQLPTSQKIRVRLSALARVAPSDPITPATALRLQFLADCRAQLSALDRQERAAARELALLVRDSGCSLSELPGLDTRSVAELLIEVGDPRRFTEGGFGRFNGSAPLAASTGEGAGEPVRHRYNPGGNRRVNRILHIMAITQLRYEPRAQTLYARARAAGHSKAEARRILKRHLSNVIYRRMIRDLARPLPAA